MGDMIGGEAPLPPSKLQSPFLRRATGRRGGVRHASGVATKRGPSCSRLTASGAVSTRPGTPPGTSSTWTRRSRWASRGSSPTMPTGWRACCGPGGSGTEQAGRRVRIPGRRVRGGRMPGGPGGRPRGPWSPSSGTTSPACWSPGPARAGLARGRPGGLPAGAVAAPADRDAGPSRLLRPPDEAGPQGGLRRGRGLPGRARRPRWASTWTSSGPPWSTRGREWEAGRISVAHEHYISEVTRDVIRQYGPRTWPEAAAGGPVAVTCCVPRERHSHRADDGRRCTPGRGAGGPHARRGPARRCGRRLPRPGRGRPALPVVHDGGPPLATRRG